MWKSLFRKSRRRRHKNQGVSKGVPPLDKNVLRDSAHLLESKRLHAISRRMKTLKLNTLGRLEAAELSRTVPDKSFNDYPNKNLELRHELKPMMRIDYDKPEKLVFKKDSEICRERQRRRDDILRRTGGKGLKVKNALWNVTSYIQCK